MSQLPPGRAGGVPGQVGVRSGPGRWIRAGLLLLVLAELVLAIQVGRWIGAAATVLALLLISVAGIWVLRRLGRQALRAWDPAARPDRGYGPGPGPRDLGDTATVAAGGLLLAVPGFLSGLAGLLLVLPPTRRGLRPLLRRLTLPATERLFRVAGLTRVVRGEVVPPGPSPVQVEVLEVRDVEPPAPGGRDTVGAGSAGGAAGSEGSGQNEQDPGAGTLRDPERPGDQEPGQDPRG